MRPPVPPPVHVTAAPWDPEGPTWAGAVIPTSVVYRDMGPDLGGWQWVLGMIDPTTCSHGLLRLGGLRVRADKTEEPDA